MDKNNIGPIILVIIAIIVLAFFIPLLIKIAWGLASIGVAIIALIFIAKILEFLFGE